MTFDSTDVIVVTLGAMSEITQVNKPAAARLIQLCSDLAADLRDLHERTGISLDNWHNARIFVEAFTGPVENNNA